MGSTVLTGSKMRRRGLFLSVYVERNNQGLKKQLDLNANLRKTSQVRHKIGHNKKSCRNGKHFSCSKTIILLFLNLIILSVNKCFIPCDGSPIPESSDILLDSLPTINEDESVNYDDPFRLTPVFPSEEGNSKQEEDIEDDTNTGHVSSKYWRYLPSSPRITDDNGALSRFMWPAGFMSNYHGPRRNELSSMFRNPFTKRAARGHLRFVKPAWRSRRSAKARVSATDKPTIDDLLKVLQLKLKELQLIVKRSF